MFPFVRTQGITPFNFKPTQESIIQWRQIRLRTADENFISALQRLKLSFDLPSTPETQLEETRFFIQLCDARQEIINQGGEQEIIDSMASEIKSISREIENRQNTVSRNKLKRNSPDSIVIQGRKRNKI